MKTCIRCKETKPFEDFSKQSGGRASYRSQCRKCLGQAKVEWSRKNREKASAIEKRSRIKTQYRLTTEQYQALIENGCQVCGSKEKLHVDHDHSCCPTHKTCGKCVRGILCQRHNFALGAVRDSVEELEALKNYLLLHGKN